MQLLKLPPPSEFTCTIEPGALAEREGLLAESAILTAVRTEQENTECAVIGSGIQKMLKEVEGARKELTAPYLARQRDIKEISDDFCNPLLVARDRLGRLAAVYRVEEERKAADERRARAEEIVRLQEAERKSAEQARLSAAAGDLAGALMADLIQAAATNATTVAISTPAPEATKTTGQAFQDRVLCFECTDPHALYLARPELCNAPTPKASAIKAVCSPDHPIPGLKLWYESKVSFKSR